MDLSSEEWSASEIMSAKDLIASHNSNNSYAYNMNKKHSDIVDALQARFPTKGKCQVINLYVDLRVEMLQRMLSNNHNATSSSKLVNENFEMPLDVPAMETMDMLSSYPVGVSGAKRKVEEDPCKKLTPQTKRQHPVKFWTKDEHSINDIGLYDLEPWLQNNASSLEGLTFNGDTYNPKHNGTSSHLTAMNNLDQQIQLPSLYHGDQASNNKSLVVTLGQQQQMWASASDVAPTMERNASKITWVGDQEADFLID